MKTICIPKTVFIIIGFAVLTSYSGQWEVFTNKNDVRDIALTDNTLWAATTGGVVAWNLGDNSYKSYTTLDGLLSCNINQVAIDKKGRPWVATKNPTGLFVYENHSWKHIKVGDSDNELKNRFISGLEVDQFGNVWISTENRYLLRNDGKTWHKHQGVYGPLTLDLEKKLITADSLIGNHFRIVSFNGSEFVSKWRSKAHTRVEYFTLANIAQDSKGNLWVSYFDDKSGETYGVICNNTIYNTLDGLGDDNVRNITADKSGPVWCATDGGISKFTGTDWVTYDTTGGVASNLVYRILIDSNNTLYAATSNGISILKSNRFKTLRIKNELPHNNHTDIVVDKSDAVILAGNDHFTIYNGLQWKMNYFQNIRLENSDHQNYKTFIKSKNGTLYAIGNGIGKGWILKQGTGGSTFFRAFSHTLEKHNRFRLPAVVCSNNDSCFWLAGVNGDLILVNKKTISIFPPNRLGVTGKGHIITCMSLDRDGKSIWIGYRFFSIPSGNEIVHFDGDTVKERFRDERGSSWTAAIASDSSENLWFATNVNRYYMGGVFVLHDTEITDYVKDRNGKKLGSCNVLFVDKNGVVWTHTDNGIARFDGSSWELFDSTTISPDLPYSRRSHIIQDKSGTLWFGTKGSGVLAYKANRWYQFTTRDGLPCNSIRACALDSKDNLWILTDYGIAMRKVTGLTPILPHHNFSNHLNKSKIIQRGNRFYINSKDKPKMIRYTLYDLRGRVVFRQTMHRRKAFVIPERYFRFGSDLRILSISIENKNGYQSKYFLKIRKL